METINPFRKLLSSRKFWLAVFGLVQTIIFQFVPQFPEVVWQAVDVLVCVLISTIALEDAAANLSNIVITKEDLVKPTGMIQDI